MQHKSHLGREKKRAGRKREREKGPNFTDVEGSVIHKQRSINKPIYAAASLKY